MLVIDSHLDLSYNALNWNRDLTRTVAEIRRAESGMTAKGRGTNTVAFPEMRRGEIGICLATVLARANPRGRTEIDFRNQEIACAMARGQLAWYQLLEKQGQCRMIRDVTGLHAAYTQWTS